MADGAPSRRVAVVLWLVTLSVLGGGVGAAYLRQGTQEVTVDDALRDFRRTAAEASAAELPSPAPAPSPEPSAPPVAAAPEAGPAGAHPAGSGASRSAPPSPTPAAAASPAAAPPPGTPAPSTGPTAIGADPEEGVYRYTTEGYEATNALGGSRHDYPAETAVTVRRTGCGFAFRWQPLRERWDESEICREPDALAVRRFVTFHEFFQRGQQQEFTCPAGSHVYRASTDPATWTWRCEASGGAIETVVTALGTETLTIEGRELRAPRFRYESTLSGANRGTQRQERWLHPDTGLNLRIRTDIDTEADSPFGAVHYEEHYTITLASTSPRR